MAKIAIIDDNKDQRESTAIELKLFLEDLGSDLEVISSFPFEKFSDYCLFIENEEILALIVDERLYNDSEPDRLPVEYNGSDLVTYIRMYYKNIPFFTLTTYPTDTALKEKLNEYDYIISKRDFSIQHAEIIQRSCHRYYEEYQKELSDYNILTMKVASGIANENEKERLQALQEKLQIPFYSDLHEREDWLKEYDSQIEQLVVLTDNVKKKIKK